LKSLIWGRTVVLFGFLKSTGIVVFLETKYSWVKMGIHMLVDMVGLDVRA